MAPSRRGFLFRLSSLCGGLLFFGSCRNTGKPSQDAASDKIDENRKMPRDLVYRLLDQKVNQHMQVSAHCAQSSFLALQEQFGLDGEQVLKALTPLPGIAERGETCGAVTGPLMAIGLVCGRDRLQLGNWEKYQESLLPAGEFCRRFESEFGSTFCRDVQKGKFGRSFQLTDTEELAAFREANATSKCSEVVRSSVRMAADIILDLEF